MSVTYHAEHLVSDGPRFCPVCGECSLFVRSYATMGPRGPVDVFTVGRCERHDCDLSTARKV